MIDAWITQLRKGVLEFALLLALERGENYGYEIVSTLREAEGLAVSESTVYPILVRLRGEGFLRSRDVASASGPPRKYFSLTGKGRLRLAEMKAYWPVLCRSLERLQKRKKKEQER